MSAIPPRTLRLFADGAPDLDDPAARGGAVARVLEDGDRSDVAWLAGAVGRRALAAWVERHGRRRLSRRSRAFWWAALGLGRAPRSAGAEALWPLA